MSISHRKYIAFIKGAAAFLVSGVLSSTAANANGAQFDADKIMNKMNDDERTGYLAGVIEGLAVARYIKDGKQAEGMNCIYDWFYKQDGALRSIYDAFDKYPTYPPGAIVDVLAKQKCGE